jgi:DNA-directed RNA polymerase subunit RPC12/RpoP
MVRAEECGHEFNTDFVRIEMADFCPTCAVWNPETTPVDTGNICTTCEEVVESVAAYICPTCGKKLHPELDVKTIE